MKRKQLATTKDRVLRFLKSAPGTAYSANEIAAIMGIREKHVSAPRIRTAIRDLRFDGQPICSGPDGFWYSRKRHEIEETCASLIRRAQAIIEAAQAMRGTPARDPRSGVA